MISGYTGVGYMFRWTYLQKTTKGHISAQRVTYMSFMHTPLILIVDRETRAKVPEQRSRHKNTDTVKTKRLFTI